MKYIIGAIIGVLVIVGALVWSQSSKTNTSERTFTEVQQDVVAGAKLYDVRTPEEYAAGHFENAILLPLQDIEAEKLPEVPRDTQIYVYCRSGNRSSQAKILLERAGFTNITDLGGLSDVEKIGGVQQL